MDGGRRIRRNDATHSIEDPGQTQRARDWTVYTYRRIYSHGHENGKSGLLATYQLGKAVEGFPDLTDEIDNVLTKDGKKDLFMLTAIFRDYSYVASAYILEPCWEKRPSRVVYTCLCAELSARCPFQRM